MVNARLRAGNVGTAEGALKAVPDVVDRAQKSFCDVAMAALSHTAAPYEIPKNSLANFAFETCVFHGMTGAHSS